MDDIEYIAKTENDYAAGKELNSFDRVLPEEPVQLSTQSKRIVYKTKSGTTQNISLEKENKYHQIIFKACVVAFKSDWFNGLSDRSKPVYFDLVRLYFNWINETSHSTYDSTRYEALKQFEAYCINEQGRKLSPLTLLNQVIKEGMGDSALSDPDYEYLQALLLFSKPVRGQEPESVTLSSWFDLPWLRSIIGEQAYLQLESPRLLLKSFRVTIATTLLYLLEQRKRWQLSPTITGDISVSNWQFDWNRKILERDGNFNKEWEPGDEFTQLLWLDLVKPSGQLALKAKFEQDGWHKLQRAYLYQQKRVPPWQLPIFFHPDYQTQYSRIEELMCSWLVACEAIQPSDISKLKVKNYTRERNASGRLIAMECVYYKGRSGIKRKPAILMGNDPWTKAMDRYIAGLSVQSLFTKSPEKELQFPTFRMHSIANFLFKVWKLPSFRKQLDFELQRVGSTTLFLDAMLALEYSDEGARTFCERTGKSIDEYSALVSRELPAKLFTFTHIKNTAVHAGADLYRSEDLINHHSHTSLTEKISYLTDQNKEWVNQAARVTRLVLNDLQNVVFQPSITAIQQSVSDLELRTQISEATNTDDVVTHSIHGGIINNKSDSTIVVLDTYVTAIQFIHYITQAEALLPRLLLTRPDWVERTLIVKIEWMARTLTCMRSAAVAKKIYKDLAVHLPPLFEYLLETTE